MTSTAQAHPGDPPAPSSSSSALAVLVPTANEGVLVIHDVPVKVTVFLGDQLIPREQLPHGILLPHGEHTIRFHWTCGQDTFQNVKVHAGDTVRFNAGALLEPRWGPPTGGVPVERGFGCCGSAHSAAGRSEPTHAAAFALLVGVLAARRRKQLQTTPVCVHCFKPRRR